MAYLLLLPVLAGLLLWWVSRNDRRREFVQQRLNTLTKRGDETIAPTLHRLEQVASSALIPQNFRVRLDAEFAAAGNRIGPLHLAIAALISAILVVAFTGRILALNSTLIFLSGFLSLTVSPVIFLRVAQSRYRNRFLKVFPDALDLVRRGIKAGLPVNEALVIAGREIADPVGVELRRAIAEVQIGVPVIHALQEAANRIRVPDFHFMVVALALQQKTGGSLAETLANLSGVIRARKALRLKARALSAEAKVSAMVLAALPFLVGGAMYLVNYNLMRSLIVDPRGRFMVGLAFLSLVTGLTTMYVLVRRALR
jgi:tight adherence protein B